MPKITLPTKPLADVNLLKQDEGSYEVVVCFMPDPDLIVGEGNSSAFLALDASTSLKKMYGFGGPFGGDPNYVEVVAKKLGSILGDVTKTGKVSGLYWAVSPDGGKIELIGEFDQAGWGNASISGPKKEKWGKGTKLLPALKYGVEEIAKNSDWTMGVILTDGIIEDEQDCFKYCYQIGKEIVANKIRPIKLVMIGIGEEVDKDQLERFNDMFEGTGIDYDLWAYGMVSSMKNEADILAVLYGELITEDTTIAPTGHVEDSSGQKLISWSDGVPGKFRFVLPRGESSFTIKIPNLDIKQDVSEVVNS